MKPRKIVQVATLALPRVKAGEWSDGDPQEQTLVALGDDGSLWYMNFREVSEWHEIHGLPPIEEPEGEEK